jgi:transcriptional regulator with XRE-family HTH domain
MAESFGARLRQQRERQLIALSTIADQTKINQSLLEGLEQGDVSHWPCGIFRRSFVRTYAQSIGLEPEAVVREFLELYPDSIDDPAVKPVVTDESADGHRPPMRLRYLINAAMKTLSLGETRGPQRAPSPRQAEAQPLQRDVPYVEPMVVTPAPLAPDSPQLEFSIADEPVAVEAVTAQPNLSAVASLCTQLAKVLAIRDVGPLLESATDLLDAIGVVVWLWDPQATALRPALAHGYSDDVLAKMPKVRRDTDNATAASFRSAQTRIVNSTDNTSGAVVVPLLTPDGCVGVFAVELRPGGEQQESVRALAAILAAQLATSLGFSPLAEAVNA